MTLDSEWVVVHRLALLSGIEPQNIHCCIQSCIAYTGQYVHDERCPFCNEGRYTKHGHPQRTFMYIPLIPQLQALFHNPTIIEQMAYRHNFVQSDRLIRDVFDGKWYHKLRSRHVVVDGPHDRRRGGPSATPILLQNFNLPPQIRTRLENLICVGSFLAPFDDERAVLADGDGDIVAIEKLLNIKGHNAIQGVQNITGHGKPRPSLDPRHLPLHSHQSYLKTHNKLQSATTRTEKAAIAKQTGIRGPPALRRVESLDYSKSFPYEWMHLFLENIVPTLVNLWTGRFKGLDSDDIWEEIGAETVGAIKDIPAAFVRALGNIAHDPWGFWFMYLAPIILKDRFEDVKYYDHMCELAGMMKKMLQFQLTHEDRLSTCTLPIHGLLHVASGIRFCGPVWTSWTFYMERYCGFLQAHLHSRQFPWSNISRRVLYMAYLTQVTVKYDLGEDFRFLIHVCACLSIN
ncbi:uncharacterized protein EDB91DRAFT_1236645 [Suillus paluster]|uniref:uncharacterized protein n=1 Tax=Suillus paluster TaxID=48578 RepID=UPI001B874477|nr:uncharacterized protein EDB91DRAFT_1236645 [Suillus paluster]KAG1743594.1 hypothetical protein EDB91DRAFT_1236645 [Suillus paluster]